MGPPSAWFEHPYRIGILVRLRRSLNPGDVRIRLSVRIDYFWYPQRGTFWHAPRRRLAAWRARVLEQLRPLGWLTLDPDA